MARIMPDVNLDDVEHGSERDLLRAFQAGLSDDYWVLHSFPWLQPDRDAPDAPVREGEADFLLLHPQRGVMVIEAKGGEIVLRDRVWRRRTEKGLEPIKDPVKQARRSLYALRDRVRALAGEEAAAAPFASAVAFPHSVFKDEPPADLPVDSIFTFDDLKAIGPAVERAYGVVTAGGRALSGSTFEKLKRALAPEFRVYEPLKLTVDATTDALSRLTRQQLDVLNTFGDTPRAVVRGVAGSGKTLLAVARARAFAADGRQVLFTCYNTELAEWVRELVADDHPVAGAIKVANFHRLASDLCRRAGIEFQPASGREAEAWWDETAPDLLVQASMTLEGKAAEGALFDAVVVDEAQDFHPSWWDALAYLQGLNEHGHVWAFWDRDQSLRREPVAPPLAGALPLTLSTNCRNTRRIVISANTAGQVESRTYDHAPLGRPPQVTVAASPQALPGIVQAEVQRLLRDQRLRPSQIALIGPAAWRNGPLAKMGEIGGVALVDSAAAWRAGGGLLCTTARKFKGLESDVVVLYGFSGLGNLFTAGDLYVVMTRARAHLLIVCSDKHARSHLEPAIDAAKALGAEAVETSA